MEFYLETFGNALGEYIWFIILFFSYKRLEQYSDL